MVYYNKHNFVQNSVIISLFLILFFGTFACSKSKNSIGMQFVVIQKINLKVCIHETTVDQYKAFQEATGYGGGYSSLIFEGYRDGKVMLSKHDNPDPGLNNGQHPIVNISGIDSVAFCEWLTTLDRKNKIIDEHHYYRLPTSDEWSAILIEGMGSEVRFRFPWGNQFPPPKGTGNFLDGKDTANGNSPIPGYHDGYQYTSPIGSFLPNKLGIYDLDGNVYEYCTDKPIKTVAEASKAKFFRRGGSFMDSAASDLEYPMEHEIKPGGYLPTDALGFRCILVADNINQAIK